MGAKPTNENSPVNQLYKSIQTFDELAINAECKDKLWRYNDALMQSIHSIIEDRECDEDKKMQYLTQSLEGYANAMFQLVPKLIKHSTEPPKATINPIGKSDPNRYDEIEEIEKFNPYHDRLGRFATADGATSFTFKPGQGKMYDNAIAREKQRDAGLIDNPKTNPKTKPKDKPKEKPKETLADKLQIPGVKQGKPMTHEEADEGRANPNFDKGIGYRINCQSCVVTYVARRNGLDVQTKPNTKGSKLEYLSRYTHEAWIDPKTGKTPEAPKRNEAVTTAKKCRTWMEDTIQPGEIYTFAHGWKGRGNSGHIVIARKNSKGNLEMFDPQTGKTRTDKDIDQYLSSVRYVRTFYGQKYNVGPRLLRVDNLQINPDFAKHIMEATK